MTHWSFNPILGSYLLVALATLGLFLLLLVRPAFRALSPRRRWTLLGLRGALILLLLFSLLRPTVVTTTRKPQTAVLLLLFDTSRSMTLPSATSGVSRWQAQFAALQAAFTELAGSGPTLDVRSYGYDADLEAVTAAPGDPQFPEQPSGDQTDIGSTLYDAVRQELGKRLAGVVLMGDGTQTAFAPRVEITSAVRELARLNCPLYTVAFGPPGDVGQSRDVAIESLPEQYNVFVKNELVVRGMVRVRGYANQEIPAELAWEDSTGNRRVVGSARLQAREDNELLPVEIPLVPDRPGQYKLTLRIQQQAGELVTRNNELTAFLTVLEGGLRTLYLYGNLLGEQRLLRRAIDLSPDIQLDDVYIDPLNRAQWPVNLNTYLANPFDVIILESVPAAAISDADQQRISQSIERGRGFMMIGGFLSFGPGGYFGEPLADVLPVTMDRFDRQEPGVDQPIMRDLHLWGELPMVPARPHPITRLASAEKNTETWQSLPKLRGANLFRQLKPRAQVLATTDKEQPLLVSGDYGQGRVLAFAGDSTARWSQFGHQLEHRRFWRQAILWLARREEAERNDVWIQLEQRRLPVGARVTFSAGARSAAGDPLTGATLQAELVEPGGSRRPIALSQNGDQVSGSVESLATAGDYLIEVRADYQGQPAGSTQASFQLLDRDVELTNAAADYDLLERLAQQTKVAGGQTVSPEELPELLRQLKQRQQKAEMEVQTKWQLGDTASLSWLYLLLFVGVIASEWLLRKKWGLV